MDTPWQHTTVLLNEAVDSLLNNPDATYVDATFGRGGHSRLILSRLGPQGRLVAFDRDTDAISAGITSLQVVFSNLPVMLLWGALLTSLVVVALIPWGAGLLIIGPWLGHASWHAFRGSVRWLDENVKVTPTT